MFRQSVGKKPGRVIALAAALFACAAAASHGAAPGKGKGKDAPSDQRQVTDKPRPSDFKATVNPAQEAKLHLDLGRAFEASGNFDGAVAEYATAIEVCKRKHARREGTAPDRDMHALAHRRLAGAYDRLGEFKQSEFHYREALKQSPNDPKVWNDAGYSYYLQSRFADAERSLKMAVKLDRDNPRYQINLGLSLSAAGKTEESFAVLEKIVGPAAAHANIAYVLAGRGRTDQARQHYEQASTFNPISRSPARPSGASTVMSARPASRPLSLRSRVGARPSRRQNPSATMRSIRHRSIPDCRCQRSIPARHPSKDKACLEICLVLKSASLDIRSCGKSRASPRFNGMRLFRWTDFCDWGFHTALLRIACTRSAGRFCGCPQAGLRVPQLPPTQPSSRNASHNCRLGFELKA